MHSFYECYSCYEEEKVGNSTAQHRHLPPDNCSFSRYRPFFKKRFETKLDAFLSCAVFVGLSRNNSYCYINEHVTVV